MMKLIHFPVMLQQLIECCRWILVLTVWATAWQAKEQCTRYYWYPFL